MWRSKLTCTFARACFQCTLLGCLYSLCSSGYLASAFCPVVASTPGTLNPLLRIKGPPCRPLPIPPSHILHSSHLANTPSSLSKLPLTQSTWPPKEEGQPQTHWSCLPSHCSCLPWAKQLCHLPCLIPLCLLRLLPPQRDKHSSYFVWSAQIPCDGWM